MGQLVKIEIHSLGSQLADGADQWIVQLGLPQLQKELRPLLREDGVMALLARQELQRQNLQDVDGVVQVAKLWSI